MANIEAWKILKKTYPHAKYYLNFKTPLDLMVAAILSARVRDEVVNAATQTLFAKYKKADDYAGASVDDLLKFIGKVSFAGNKARNIVAACKLLVERHGGKVPKNMGELTELPGIGSKTANAILQNAYDIIVGVPCDTHVLRVAFRLGWTKNTNPEKVEADLMKLFPKSEWDKLPHVLKAHGRAACAAPDPYCSKCPVNKLCPKAGVKKRL
ncbi:endonuclease III [Candidatus Woesearchaeota archaeon]|nr:endonuclease III [Candidatus Woesearchaeota archaeon]